MKPSVKKRTQKIVQRAKLTFRPSRIQKTTRKPSQLIVKSVKGILLEDADKHCDECKQLRDPVTCFSKSNRNYTVFVCKRCLERVLDRSFPERVRKKTQKRVRARLEELERIKKTETKVEPIEGIDTPPDDALNHTVFVGIMGAGRRA